MYKKNMISFLIAFCFMISILHAQNAGKIHPALLSVIQEEKEPTTSTHFQSYNLSPLSAATGRKAPTFPAIIYTTNPDKLVSKGYHLYNFTKNFALAQLTIDEMKALSLMEEVNYIDADKLDYIVNDAARSHSKADLLQQGALNNTRYTGKGVIIGIIDTGIDVKHPDFIVPGKPNESRILFLWDQTITAQQNESSGPQNRGVLYNKTNINNSLAGSGTIRSTDINGHGTHVAGIAAGNGNYSNGFLHKGMAPEADLVIVKAGNDGFANTNVISALYFLDSIATVLNKPLVINLSFGGLTNQQDGTAPHEVVIDAITASKPGRIITVAAGNTGAGKKHKQTIIPPGSYSDIVMELNPIAHYSNNSALVLQAISDIKGIASAEVILPDGSVLPLSSSANHQNNHYNINLFQNMSYLPNRTQFHFFIQKLTTTQANPANGKWTLRIYNYHTTPLSFHYWYQTATGQFSNAAIENGDNQYLIHSPGTAANAITVGNYTATGTSSYQISSSSSVGPAISEVLKPEITAIGTDVFSAKPFPANITNTYRDYYIAMSGTSMATPVVTGGIALLLQAYPTANFAAIKKVLTEQADKDSYTGYTPNPVWGHGKFNTLNAMAALAGCVNNKSEVLHYNTGNAIVAVNIDNAAAGIKYTPAINGILGGVWLTAGNITDSFAIEVRSAAGQQPSPSIIQSITVKAGEYLAGVEQYFDLSKYHIELVKEEDFYIIIKNLGKSGLLSIYAENKTTQNKSVITTNGNNFTLLTDKNLRIRALVYKTQQYNASIPSSTTGQSVQAGTPLVFDQHCQLLSQVIPLGENPVAGNIDAKVIINNQHGTVKRIYEFVPETNGSALLTLYYAQTDFDDFNAASGAAILPTSPTDSSRFNNIIISKYEGTSEGTGNKEAYSGHKILIHPTKNGIFWNASASRWEVTFPVNSFSSFLIEQESVLPVTLAYFKGEVQDNANRIYWEASCKDLYEAAFLVLHSTDGRNFTEIDKTTYTMTGCIGKKDFLHYNPTAGRNFYQLKIIENGTMTTYSDVVSLYNGKSERATVWPTQLTSGQSLKVNVPGRATIQLYSSSGKMISNHTLNSGQQTISLPTLSSGIYQYKIVQEKDVILQGQLMITL